MATMNGPDVSGYQSPDVTAQVPLDFAFVKATQGNDYVSGNCDPQVQHTIQRGAGFGVYHFTDGKDVASEANWFLQHTQGYRGHGIPIIDFEAGGLKQGGGWLLDLARRIESGWGVKPLIYMSLSVAERGDMAQVAANDNGLWVAYGSDYGDHHDGYSNIPADSQSGQWKFAIARQYTSQGFLNGIGPLDLNVFYGDRSVFDKYVGGSSSGGGVAPTPPTPSVPAFPLPAGWYYGPKSGPTNSVSGYFPPYGGSNGAPGLREWQQQMRNRGNNIGVDGLYGPQTATIAGNFQAQCHLTKDQLIGPQTWAAAWTAPVTSQPLS